VREGLLFLKGEGFVELKPRRGFVVAPLSASDVSDLFTAQALLAGELVSRATARMTPDDLRELDKVHRELRKAAAVGDTTIAADTAADACLRRAISRRSCVR